MSNTKSASARPSSSRHNFHHVIHKGLRLGHCRQLAAIGSADFSDEAASGQAIASLREFLGLARSHLEGENREIHAALESCRPGASAHAAQDHDNHETSFAEIEALLRAIEETPPAGRKTAADALYRRYALFAAHDLEHMDAEESELLAVLHDTFTDAELIAIEHRIVAAIPPEKMAKYLMLMMPAINHAERVDFLRLMQAGMPPEAFDGALNGAIRPALDETSFKAAIAALGMKMAA